MRASVVAVVLAGGKSSRMGQDKAALYSPKLQNTLLEQCLDAVMRLDDCEVLISSNTHPQGIKDQVAECGPLSGIHAITTLYHAHPPAIGYLFIAVDMPNLAQPTLEALLQFGQQNHSAAYINNSYLPCFLPANPQLTRLVNQQLRSQDWSLRALLANCGAKSMSWQDTQQLVNINEPQDWQQYCGQYHDNKQSSQNIRCNHD